MGRRHEVVEGYYEQLDIDSWCNEVGARIDLGESEAIDEALAFLEHDPYFFRSGYARERMARRLARTKLTPPQATRARVIVMSTVNGQRHCPQPGIGRLARAVADNPLRRELRARLHADAAVARRALRTLVNVRHPGLTADDISAARRLVLTDAARGQWLSPATERLAIYLWSNDWEAELRTLLPYHGPDRAAAKRLLGVVDRRRQRPRP